MIPFIIQCGWMGIMIVLWIWAAREEKRVREQIRIFNMKKMRWISGAREDLRG